MKARPVTIGLQAGQSELGPESGRFGVHAVRPPDSRHRREFEGPALQDRDQASYRDEKQVCSPYKRRRQGGVDHVGGGEAVMDP